VAIVDTGRTLFETRILCSDLKYFFAQAEESHYRQVMVEPTRQDENKQGKYRVPFPSGQDDDG
jgi:hypothetical protein